MTPTEERSLCALVRGRIERPVAFHSRSTRSDTRQTWLTICLHRLCQSRMPALPGWKTGIEGAKQIIRAFRLSSPDLTIEVQQQLVVDDMVSHITRQPEPTPRSHFLVIPPTACDTMFGPRNGQNRKRQNRRKLGNWEPTV